MRRFARFAAAVSSAVLATSGVAAAAAAGPPPAISPHWTTISPGVGFGFASAGLMRTADGRLHVVWPSADPGSYSLHYSTVGPSAKLLATGTILSHWGAIDQFPRLVLAPHGTAQPGLRVIFDGANGQAGSPYNVGTFYSATASSSGTGWALTPGSLSHTTFPPLTDDAAAVEPDGKPVTAGRRAMPSAITWGSTPASRPRRPTADTARPRRRADRPHAGD